jgi:DNA-binding winged helix-turn-helix (wHTH) protein
MCAIGDLFFDAEQKRLFKAEQEVPLRRQSLILLSYLVRHRGRVVPKSELIAAVWPDTFITENSLAQCVADLRRAFGDRWRNMIKTVPGRGCLLTADDPGLAPESMRRALRRRTMASTGKARRNLFYAARPMRASAPAENQHFPNQKGEDR